MILWSRGLGHGEERWASRATTVIGICSVRRWTRSSTWATRWCGWPTRSVGAFSNQRFSAVCQPGPGQPPLPTRLVAGLLILKHTHNLSDEVPYARWPENPYYQYFCVFCHRLPFDRTSLTRRRQRLGEAQLAALLQGSLPVAHKTEALAIKDLERVAVDPRCSPRRSRTRPMPG